jgi:hypothetical protein
MATILGAGAAPLAADQRLQHGAIFRVAQIRQNVGGRKAVEAPGADRNQAETKEGQQQAALPERQKVQRDPVGHAAERRNDRQRFERQEATDAQAPPHPGSRQPAIA